MTPTTPDSDRRSARPFAAAEPPNVEIDRVLGLSQQVSTLAPLMKPFVRFAPAARPAFAQARTHQQRERIWDFDATAQRSLLGVLRAVATPAQVARAMTRQWRRNLGPLLAWERSQLDDVLARGKRTLPPPTPRERFVLSQLRPGSRFLYIGCGAGSQCLTLSSHGHRVVGIDTHPGLVALANARARAHGLDVSAICMDASDLAFRRETIDGALHELCGYEPSLEREAAALAELATMLRPDGVAVFVASRRRYASHWYKAATPYPTAMTSWLVKQAGLDGAFSDGDRHQEMLAFGVFFRSHTVESLSTLVGEHFQVVECAYEATDLRYVICTARPSAPTRRRRPPPRRSRGAWPDGVPTPFAARKDDILSDVASLCAAMSRHSEEMITLFAGSADPSRLNPLAEIKPDLGTVFEIIRRLSRLQE